MPGNDDKASENPRLLAGKQPFQFSLKSALISFAGLGVVLSAAVLLARWLGHQFATNEFFGEILLSLACIASVVVIPLTVVIVVVLARP